MKTDVSLDAFKVKPAVNGEKTLMPVDFLYHWVYRMVGS